MAGYVKKPINGGNLFICTFIFHTFQKKTFEISLKQGFCKKQDLFPNQKETKGMIETLLFESSDYDINVYSSLKEIHDTFKNIANRLPDKCLKNQAMLLDELNNRAIDKKRYWHFDILRAMHTTDSEAKAIYILQQKYVIDNIIKELKAKIPQNDYVTNIEFHGCTTNDMCGFCFTNMNIIQFLANNDTSTNFSFLKYLKEELKHEELIPSTKMFISSTKPFPFNTNFFEETIQNTNEECLYQFRI